MKSKFYLRLIVNNKILYESPTEGDEFIVSNIKNPKTIAKDLVKAINSSSFPGSKYIKAKLV